MALALAPAPRRPAAMVTGDSQACSCWASHTHNAQRTTHNAQRTTHSTQHTAHSTQPPPQGGYKVETIGDGFMAVGGAPSASGEVEAAERMSRVALRMMQVRRRQWRRRQRRRRQRRWRPDEAGAANAARRNRPAQPNTSQPP